MTQTLRRKTVRTMLAAAIALSSLPLLLSACSSEPKKPQIAAADMTDAERAYLEYRASHAGVEIPSRVEEPEPDPAPKPTAKPLPEDLPAIEATPAPSPSVAVSEPKPATPTVPTPAPTNAAPVKAPTPAPKPVAKPVVKKAPQPAPKPAVRITAADDSTSSSVSVGPVVDPNKPAPKPAPKAASNDKYPPKETAPLARSKTKPQPNRQPKSQSVKRITTVAAAEQVTRANMPRAVQLDQSSSTFSLSAGDSYSGGDGNLLTAIDVLEGRTVSITNALPTATPLASSSAPNGGVADLMRGPDMSTARQIVSSADSYSVAQVAEALRLVAYNSAANMSSQLYNIATTDSREAVRLLAADALFIGYPIERDRRAAALLNSNQPTSVRVSIAQRVIAHGIVNHYDEAIAVLAADASGNNLFNARREIVAAGPSIIRSLVRAAVQRRGTDAMFVARRLFRWIEGGNVESAYRDTFDKNPSVLGAVMFAERFGQAGVASLKQARGKVGSDVKDVIDTQLKEIAAGRTFREIQPGSVRLYVVTYETGTGSVSLLTNKALLAGQSTRVNVRWSDSNTNALQQAVVVSDSTVQPISRLNAGWNENLRFAGKTVDFVDVK